MSKSDPSEPEQAVTAPSPDRYMRTEFLERLAHELRGPSGVTLGALDELELAMGPEVERFRPLFAMARRGVRKVLRTAERLSRTAQLEGGHLTLSPMPGDLAALVRRTCSEAESVEGRRTVTLEMRSLEAPCSALIDAGWAQVALFEVVTQAIRSARKQVIVELARVDNACLVRVWDDGMATRSATSLRFEPQTDRRDSGLAMPLALDIARAHGGDLRLETAAAPASGVTAVMVFAAA